LPCTSSLMASNCDSLADFSSSFFGSSLPVDSSAASSLAPGSRFGNRESTHSSEVFSLESEVALLLDAPLPAEGLDAVIVNPALVFGVGGPDTNTRRIVDAVRSGWMVAAPPGGTNVVDVQDVAAGHRAAMAQGESGERYLLGGENRSWRSILGTLAEAFGIDPPQYTIPGPLLTAGAFVSEAVAAVTRTRPFLPRSTARTAAHTHRFDNTRAREALGCTFREFDETARRIAAALDDPSGD